MPSSQPSQYRLVGESVLRAVRGALEQAVRQWAAEWGCAGQVEVGVQRAWDSAQARTLAWKHGVGPAGTQVWLATGSGLGPEIQQMLFPADAVYGPDAAAPAALATAGAQQALDALCEALGLAALPGQRHAGRHDADAVPAAVWRRGSGALVAQVRVGRKTCGVLLGGAAVQAFRTASAALPALAPVDLEASVAPVPVALELDLGAARVGLGALLALGVGDVIRLDRAADAPLALRTASGQVLFDAYLGRSGDALAVEVVKYQS